MNRLSEGNDEDPRFDPRTWMGGYMLHPIRGILSSMDIRFIHG